MRKIHIMNEEKRDATVALESVKPKDGPVTGVPGKKLAFRRYLAATEGGTYNKLSQQKGDLAQALIDGDPEIDVELVGKFVGDTQTVYLSAKGEVLHASPKVVDVLFGPDGGERERKPAQDVPSNTTEKESPVRWARRMPKAWPRRATSVPMRPKPITPSRRPRNSLPGSRRQRPSRRAAAEPWMFREMERMRPRVSSATAPEALRERTIAQPNSCRMGRFFCRRGGGQMS